MEKKSYTYGKNVHFFTGFSFSHQHMSSFSFCLVVEFVFVCVWLPCTLHQLVSPLLFLGPPAASLLRH